MRKQKLGKKWRFAIGATSRVPGQENVHYLMLDIDGELNPNKWKALVQLTPYAILERTRNGFHIYTPVTIDAHSFVTMARKFGADKSWIEIGRIRGYWFLADRYRAVFPRWPLERMTLHVS